MNEIILQNKDGEVLASSLDISEKFNKRHDSVLRDIGNLIKSDSTILWNEMFKESTYQSRGKEYKCYDINRDGFSLLAMGFTGKKALEWKLKYINAFNVMEEKLKSGTVLSEKERLKLQLFSKNELEVVQAHNRLIELEVREATTPLLKTIEIQKPKAEFHDAVAVAENCVDFGEFAGTFQNNLGISFGRNKIMDWCRDMDYLCSSHNLKNKPSQQMIDSGYMKYKENVNERNGKKYVTYKPLLTGKGQIWLTKKLSEYLNRVA